MNRVGLFGGSFDPVHNAHVALASSALAALQLDELRWIPAGQAWQKARTLTAADDRVAMLRLAISHEPRYRLDMCEVQRAGPSYTIATVLELKARHPSAQWFLILGQDQLQRLPTWHRWRYLVRLVTLAVANRAGESPRTPAELAVARANVVEVPMPPLLISSSQVRTQVASNQSIATLVPADVADYVETHHLYRNSYRN
ncbi:MAG: nicotinate-nucleotide adenylyltransferase [Burkholderiaceae bacterium]|nr:nicotinate-nucleotide adenylyltransferase [Burkholderiaceae bacterium]